jgi:NADP-reducing hydrogenase subunit HndB
MPQLKSMDDLMRLREEAQRTIKTRMDTGTVVTVGMGTCGIAAGARETMNAILAELDARRIDAQVTTVGCIGQCVREPLVDIAQAGRPRITYGNVRPDMVPRLIEEHLVKGQPVQEWVVGRQGPESQSPVQQSPAQLAGAAGSAER